MYIRKKSEQIVIYGMYIFYYIYIYISLFNYLCLDIFIKHQIKLVEKTKGITKSRKDSIGERSLHLQYTNKNGSSGIDSSLLE